MVLLLAVLFSLPRASASDPPWSPPTAVRDGPDGTLQVRVHGNHLWSWTYTPDGALVATTRSWVDPVDRSPEVDAAAAGNTALWRDGRLEVTGVSPCAIEAPARTGAVQVAVSATHAALADADGALLVDLSRCVPVAALGGPDWTLPADIALTSWGFTAVQPGWQLLRWWDLPGLRPAGRIGTEWSTVVGGRGGPMLVSQDQVVGPGGRTRPGEALYRFGAHVVAVDGAGQVRRLDEDGLPVEPLPAAALAEVVTIDLGGGGFTVRARPALVVRRGAEEAPAPPLPSWLDVSRLRPPPERAWPAPPIRGSTHDPCVVRRQGGGLVVTCGAVQRGVFVDSKAFAARTDAAGRVLLTHERAQGIVGIFARAVADGHVLWKTWEDVVTDFAIGPDWVAARTRDHGWRFLDPATGADLGEVHSAAAVTREHRLSPLVMGALRGARWNVPTPEDAPWTPGDDATAFALAFPELGCAGAESLLAWQAPWPEIVAHARPVLDRLCPAPAAPPPWPEGATATSDGWAWTAPEPVRRVAALDGGLLLVETDTTVGVLGPDGRLRWSRPHEAATPVGDGVLLSTGWTLQARDAATGALRWARVGQIEAREGVFWLRAGPNADPFPVDLATGGPDVRVVVPRRSFGWTCDPAGCVRGTGSSAPSPAPPSSAPERAPWRVDGATITTRGAPPATAGPPPLRAELRPRPAPPAAPVGPLPAWPSTPPGPAFDRDARFVRVVDDGRELWRAADRFPVDITGDVAVVLVRGGGACEGRALADGQVLWSLDLVGELPEVAGALFYTRGKGVTRLRDVHTGAVLRTWTRDLVLAGDPGAVVYADRVAKVSTVQDSDGRTLATIHDAVPRIAVAGDLVVVAGVEEILAFRDGHPAWRHAAHDYAAFRIVDGYVLLRGHGWRFTLDLETGEFVAAEKEPPPPR